MKEFDRSDKYLGKIFCDALDREVVLDAKVIIRREAGSRSRLRAWCETTNTNLQFPTPLRKYHGQEYICDVIKSARKGGAPFYRAYRQTIRNPETGKVVG